MPISQVVSCVRAAVDAADLDVQDALMAVAEVDKGCSRDIARETNTLPGQLKNFNCFV
jgi:hypothetical protein